MSLECPKHVSGVSCGLQYSHGKRPGGMVKCSWNYVQDRHRRCHVSRRKLVDWSFHAPCTKPEKYGYYHGRPCVLLKARYTNIASHPCRRESLVSDLDA